MKHFIISLTGILLSVACISQEPINRILEIDDCEQVVLAGGTQIYVGDDLFNLINGGAEFYHEFGFVEVIAAELNAAGSIVKVEVYDMGSSAAAWGIFSLTATSSAESISVGDAARAGVGFMQFIKDRYMIYAYAEDVEEKLIIQSLNCIANNIEGSSEAPSLYQAVNSFDAQGKHLYFKGNLGLSGIYSFHYKDVFGYEEGAANVSEDEITVVLAYPDENSSRDRFNTSYEFFSNSKKYHEQALSGTSYHMKDRKERQLDFYLEGKYIIIFIHEAGKDIGTEKTRLLEVL